MTRDEMEEDFAEKFNDFMFKIWRIGKVNGLIDIGEVIKPRKELIEIVEDFLDGKN